MAIKRGFNRFPGTLNGRSTPFMNLGYDLSDNISTRLGTLMVLLTNPDGLKADLGRTLANLLRDHFLHRNMDGPRNQFGAASSGFWGEVRDSVNDGEVTASGVVVTISDVRFVQKFYGGTIRANEHWLAIPARTEAYDRSPRLFSNLKAIFFEHGGALVQEDPATPRAKGERRIGTKKSLGMVFYWLKREVHQGPDHDALPMPDLIVAHLLETADKHIARLMNA